MRRRSKRYGLAARAKRSIGRLPPLGKGQHPIGATAQVQHSVVGPGWFGMCPVLYTQQKSLVAFLPFDIYATVRAQIVAGEEIELKFVSGGDSQELVTKLFKEA